MILWASSNAFRDHLENCGYINPNGTVEKALLLYGFLNVPFHVTFHVTPPKGTGAV